MKALGAKPVPGRPRKLAQAECERLLRLLRKGAKVYGYPDDTWTLKRVAGLIRQFFPKGLDLGQVRGQDLRRVERLLNTRPRKALGYRTPLEMLSELWSP